MRTTGSIALLLAGAVLTGGTAAAQAPAPSPSPSPAPRKLVFDVDVAMANVNDNSLRRSLGRERVTKVPYAIVGLSGELNPNLTYRVELNAVDDTRRPEPFLPSDRTPFFFPNLADPDYGVSSNPEGQFRVDDYKNTGWDPILQQQHLRRAWIDAHTASGRYGIVAGRFFVPLGLDLDDVRWFTAKDLSHIQMINAAADSGAQLYFRWGGADRLQGRVSASVISGNGSPYHDYVYFDFTGRGNAEDTNSAAGAVFDARVQPLPGLTLVGSAQFNFVGSRIETDTTLQRSKHYDNKFVAAARYEVPWLDTVVLFGQYARYKWGLRQTGAEILPGPPTLTPIWKDGFMVGADVSAPVPWFKGRAGLVGIYETLDRDDSLIAFLAARNQLGVTLGEKETAFIVKGYLQLGPVTAFVFHNHIENPFPQASAIVHTSGPFAFVSIGDAKTGVGFRFRTSF